MGISRQGYSCLNICINWIQVTDMADSRFSPSQWETSLQSNVISHLLGTNLGSALSISLQVTGHLKQWIFVRQLITPARKVHWWPCTVYPKKYAHGFVVLCFVVAMQSFIMNSNEVFIHIHQGCFGGTGAIVRLPQCQWSKPDGHGKMSMYNHNKAQQSKNRMHISWDILYRHQWTWSLLVKVMACSLFGAKPLP